MIPESAVRALDEIAGDDPQAAHAEAEGVLLAVAPAEVQEAYIRVMGRCQWWSHG